MHGHFFTSARELEILPLVVTVMYEFTNSICMKFFFFFCSSTKFWYKCCVPTYWSCIPKCIGTSSKIYNQKVNYLTDNCLHADIKKSTNMVLAFTMTHVNIFLKWLLIVSYLSCAKAKKHVAVNSKKTAVYIVFWRLCTAVVNVDTVNNIYDFRLQLHILANSV